jgi:plasmid replication initiation protein
MNDSSNPEQGELFICDVADAVLKDVMQEMEHPFYSLSKKPQTTIRRYEHNGQFIEVTPSVKGQATIFDKDILIYAISQLVAAKNRGDEIGKEIKINPHSALLFARRGTGGKEYESLCGAVDRLAGTRISTNIKTGHEEQYDNFGLIEKASIRRKYGLDGRLEWIKLTLSDWLFNAVQSEEVKSIDPAYFDLGKPLARRLYEIGKKHTGNKQKFEISLDKLFRKSGTMGTLTKFKFSMKGIVREDNLPEFTLSFSEERNVLVYKWRNQKNRISSDDSVSIIAMPPLPKEAHAAVAKKYPNVDTKKLEDEYINWWSSETRPLPEKVVGAFFGFCKKIIENPKYEKEFDKQKSRKVVSTKELGAITFDENVANLVTKFGRK